MTTVSIISVSHAYNCPSIAATQYNGPTGFCASLYSSKMLLRNIASRTLCCTPSERIGKNPESTLSPAATSSASLSTDVASVKQIECRQAGIERSKVRRPYLSLCKSAFCTMEVRIHWTSALYGLVSHRAGSSLAHSRQVRSHSRFSH